MSGAGDPSEQPLRHRARALVTGGAGFVGSHLCERLLNAGHGVVSVDNYHTGRLENIAHLQANARFTAMAGDVCERLDAEVGHIYNLACPASPIWYQQDPVGTLKTNVFGAHSVLELAVRRRATVLQASTSEVYGVPDQHPQTEAYWGHTNPIGPRACYHEGKRCAEAMFFEFHRQRGVPIKVARIFNTYGPRMAMNDGRVVSSFIVQALRAAPITIHGSGEQTRSFCYVDDLVDGLIALMATPDEVTGPVNLGNTEEVSIRGLAETVVRLTGTRSGIRHLDPVRDDPHRRQPDIAQARRVLGWRPTTALETGLLRTIEYFDRLLADQPPADQPPA